MHHPRHYQTKLIDDARELIRELRPKIKGRKPRIVLRSACGSGKTFMAALMAKYAIEKGGSVAFLVRRSFRRDPTSQTLNAGGIGHSFLAAGKWLNKRDNCHIGMIGSMKSRQ